VRDALCSASINGLAADSARLVAPLKRWWSPSGEAWQGPAPNDHTAAKPECGGDCGRAGRHWTDADPCESNFLRHREIVDSPMPFVPQKSETGCPLCSSMARHSARSSADQEQRDRDLRADADGICAEVQTMMATNLKKGSESLAFPWIWTRPRPSAGEMRPFGDAPRGALPSRRASHQCSKLPRT
jgi:hypothetical protein